MSKSEDQQHLQILSIFHYVVGGLMYVFGLFPVFHLVMGLIFMIAGFTQGGEDALVMGFMGVFFSLFASAFILAAWTVATLVIFSGRNLARRTRYTFCLIMGGVVCIFMPFGTVLGVFTILVLCRPSVKKLFGVLPPENPSSS